MILPLKLVKQIEKKIGMKIEEIRNIGPDEFKKIQSRKKNKNLTFSSEFPFIGRGNVLRNSLKTTDDINKDIDKILGL